MNINYPDYVLGFIWNMGYYISEKEGISFRHKDRFYIEQLQKLVGNKIGEVNEDGTIRYRIKSNKFKLKQLKNASIMNGYPSGEFGYDREITRAEAITVLMNSIDLVVEDEEVPEAVAEVKKESSGGSGKSTKSEAKNIELILDDYLFDDANNSYIIGKEISQIEGVLTGFSSKEEISYTISDEDNVIVKKGSLVALNSFVLDDVAFAVGENTIEINVESDQNIMFTAKIFNLEIKNFEGADVDKGDDDGDGLINYIEDSYSTNRKLKDTDDDKISDYNEIKILGTDPLKKDSDGDGTIDGDEDNDLDGLTNSYEFEKGLNPINADSDYDYLNDKEEIDLGTDPLNEDTDSDDFTDYYEVNNGMDPLTFNDGTKVVTEHLTGEDLGILEDEDIKGIEVDLTTARKNISSFTIETIDDTDFLGRMPGYLGNAFDFKIDGVLDSAIVTVEFNEELLDDPEFSPKLYYYNEEYQVLEEVENQHISGNKVVATLEHFSKYILLNSTAYDEVWDVEIKGPGTQSGSAKKLDIAFVIDSSGSMEWNDPSDIRLDLTKSFIDKMDDDDRSCIVDFDGRALVRSVFTSNKSALKNATDLIDSSGATAIYKGLDKAINQFSLIETSDDSDKLKIILLLTDGEDDGYSYTAAQYNQMAAIAKEKNIAIYTIGLGSVDEELLTRLAEITCGKYYHATAAADLQEGFEILTDETIDYLTDSNNDGISDYYTKLLCDGVLRTGKGQTLFNTTTYAAVQANADFDGDGLLNGDEITVTEYNDQVYVMMGSDPTQKYTDNDEYSDYEEVKQLGTDPTTANSVFWKDRLVFITNDQEFISNKYKEYYDDHWTERVSVDVIGTKLFGDDYSMTILYKEALNDYFNQLATESDKSSKYGKPESIEMGEMLLVSLAKMNNYVQVTASGLKGINEIQWDKLSRMSQQIEIKRNAIASLMKHGGSSKSMYNYYLTAATDYADLVDDFNGQLNSQIKTSVKIEKFSKSAKKIENVGLVFDVLFIADTAYNNYLNYSLFVSNMDLISEHIYILESIRSNTDDERLKTACNEMIISLNSESDRISIMIKDALIDVGGAAGRVVISYGLLRIPYVGQVYAVVDLVGNTVLNIKVVARECAKLYAISTSSSIMSDVLMSELKNAKVKNSRVGTIYVKYLNCNYVANLYTDLAVMRKSAEKQMDKANEENSILIKWLFTEYMYKSEEIYDNINTLDGIIENSINCGDSKLN